MSPPTSNAAPGVLGRALWTGALAGLAAGAGEALFGWGRMAQFEPGLGGKLATALHAGALYAFVFSLAAVAIAAVAVVLRRHTALGPLLDRPRDLGATAFALAAVPCTAAAFAIAYRVGYVTLLVRHHKGLIIAVTVGATAGALAGAVLASFLAGRLLELLLRRLPEGARRPLRHPLAPVLAAGALVALAAAIGAVASRKLLAQLPLGPFVSTLIWALLTIPAAAVVSRLHRRARRHALLHPAVVAGALLLALVTGKSDGVRKAASAAAGLAVPATGLVQRLFDLDRDGHSSVLGGGDCDDLDADIHPGALDLAGDGIDQNCLGGDAGRAAKSEPHFVAVPGAVPRDLNVVLITIDTVRADHFSAYGYARPTTPAIDALAARGALFVNAWAHAPSTRYSMPAILTGRYPSNVAFDPEARTPASWWPGLQPENHTIAEVMKEHGYTTGAILNYEYFDRRRRMDQGFDTYDNTNQRLHVVDRDPASSRGTSSREQADAAVAWLDGHAQSRFFLWVHFYDPHFEYEVHPGSTSFGSDKVALYDGEIRFTDDQIGRVLGRLRELGVEDRTAVIVTGDHGEGFGEHGVTFHGYDLYAAQTKVPLIITIPGIPARRVETPACHVDLLPTLANLAGGLPEPAMAGRSLLGPMTGAEDLERAIYQEVSWEGPRERRALVTRDRHLIYNMLPWGTWELYDLVHDPNETHDLWGRAPEGNALAEKLSSMIDGVTGSDKDAALLSAAPAPAVALKADFGGARFLGVDLAARVVHPGDDLEITWYWQSKAKIEAGYRPFVHFEGEAGRFLGDHEPAGGALPMTRWRPGQYIADHQKLRVPAGTRPGEYTIYLGVFKGAQRLPLSGAGAADVGENRLKVATIEVR